jgi:hypothetical protein
MTEYAEGYRDGRLDAQTATIIYLALNGYHPENTDWIDRLKTAISGTDTDQATDITPGGNR